MSRQSAGINRSFRRVFYIYFNGKLSNLKQGSIFKPMPLIYLNCIILAKKLNLFVWVNGSRSHKKQDYIHEFQKQLSKNFSNIYVIDPWVISEVSISVRIKLNPFIL